MIEKGERTQPERLSEFPSMYRSGLFPPRLGGHGGEG